MVKPFHRKPLIAAILELGHQADVETKHRKPLAAPLRELPAATWEVSVGEHRAFYEIEESAEEGSLKTARVLRVILKGTSTTHQAVSRARKP